MIRTVRELILRLSFVAGGILVLMVAAYVWLPISDDLYIAAINDKHDILSSSDSPRLVLVGGSNLAFGVDSERMEGELGYDVINMGIHADLGLRYMLAHVGPYLDRGDVVVLAPEFELLATPETRPGLEAAVAVFPRGVSYLSLQDRGIVKGVLRALQRRFWTAIGMERDRNEIYGRGFFNEHGDLTSHLSDDRRFNPALEREEMVPELTYDRTHPEVTELLNEFHRSSRARGIRVVLTFPPYPRSLSGSEERIAEWTRQLRSELEVPVISEPRAYQYADSLFFDLVYHLTRKGRELRTDRLIRDLVALEDVEVRGGL